MQLPIALKEAVSNLLQTMQLTKLEEESARLTKRYRAETRDGNMHLNSNDAAFAYIAARLPATYAAIYAAINHILDIVPDFMPKSQLDVGAGPGTAVLAAYAQFSSLQSAILVEQSPYITEIGQFLTKDILNFPALFQKADIKKSKPQDFVPADFITLAYVLDELAPKEQDLLMDALFANLQNILLIVEPGTPKGWQRLMHQRQRIIDKGGFILAPCPHQRACPLTAPDWCHFSIRVERSKIHRQTKMASVPYEDEKYCYLAVMKEPIKKVMKVPKEEKYARILQAPKRSKGKIETKLCLPDGQMQRQIVTKAQKIPYSQLRRKDWGDVF